MRLTTYASIDQKQYNGYGGTMTYTFLIFCIMPIIVTAWRAELFYDGKLVFVALVTMVYLSIGVYYWARNKRDYSFSINRINHSRYEIKS